MVADSAILTSTIAPPKSFAALMSLYESNYLRLSWIIDEFEAIDRVGTEYRSDVPDDCPLFLTVMEVSSYTTTVHLTYRFEDDGHVVADPDLSVRIYRDARLAEAMACGGRRWHPALTGFDTNTGAELRRRWTRNIMLNKWLEYCADREHRFTVNTSPSR